VDFSTIELDDETLAFWRWARSWFAEQVTEDLLDEERTTGAGFMAPVHRAMGAQGWIFPSWALDDGGAALDALKIRILRREQEAHRVPVQAGLSTTMLVVPAIERWMEGDLRRELLLGAARGTIVFCLGYTEPDAGSDLAGVRTRATRDGDEWLINGQKMFTTGAQHCHFSFLLARSDPSASKHGGLTMFLVPLDAPGIDIQAVHTMAGERTNMVFFDNVRVADRYRVGPENQGWTVLNGPLNREHAMDADGPKPLEETPGETFSVTVLEDALAAAVEWAKRPGADGLRPIDDSLVRARLADIELSMALMVDTPGPLGRVLRSERFIRDAADLVDLVGASALVRHGAMGAVGGGAIEYAHRFAQGTAIYGGTTDIFRNLIAERFLGLPRRRAPQA
jgi:alkylation response protein AidB-like acyl-CoA dehydrogenase